MAGTGPVTGALPDLPPGTVLEVAKEDWRYGGFQLFLKIEAVRPDLSTYYHNEWLWVSGTQLARDGTPLGHLDALVRVAALPGVPPARMAADDTRADRRSTAGPPADRP
jgi:hypothetical protein